jgi:lysophospholipase L1-like esterase
MSESRAVRTILFQGDSITDSNRVRQDGEQFAALGQGYVYLIAARLSCEKGNEAVRFVNRGVSGDRASDLFARWNEDAISVKPDLLSVLIGVNDAWRSMDGLPHGVTDRFARSYQSLLEETREVLPSTGLVLCEPFILNTGAPAQKWKAWQTRLSEYRQITRALAADFEAEYIPLQKVFDEACTRADPSFWLFDGVHPTPAGHYLIAQAWLDIVQASPLKIA